MSKKLEKNIRDVLIRNEGCSIKTLHSEINAGLTDLYKALNNLVKDNKITRVSESGQPDKYYNVQL